MAPGYPAFACNQHTELSKSTDRRKHLNILLHDYSEENKRLYGTAMPSAGSLLKPVREPEVHESRYQALEGEAAVSRQLAAQVNNKRTPTGQFFTTINPTLWEKQSPPATYDGQNMLDSAIATMRGSGRLGSAAGSVVSDARAPPEAVQGGGAAVTDGMLCGGGGGSGSIGGGGGTTLPPIGAPAGDATAKRPSWLLPWQTGDRQVGRAMADSIRHKRTPIGAFANRDLAKPNK